MVKLTLRGDRCRCPTCLEYFNSTYAFDQHRKGKFGPIDRSSPRYCLAPEEMTHKGFSKNNKGFWITAKLRISDPVVARSSGDLSDLAP